MAAKLATADATTSAKITNESDESIREGVMKLLAPGPHVNGAPG
jgi:hypothetical protein